MQKELRANNQIRGPEVRVIDENGKQLGTLKTQDALRLALEKELDLVEINPNTQPPLTKLMDFGKFLYQKEKQGRKAKRPKDQELKTVRVGFKTGKHDMDFKARQIEEFLRAGYQIKVELTLRGREKALSEIGRSKFEGFLSEIKEVYSIKNPISRSPFGWFAIIKK